MQNLFAIEPHVGIGIQTIENQVDIIVLPNAIFDIKLQRIIPDVLRNPLQFLLHFAFAVRMRNETCSIQISVCFRWQIHLQIDVQSVGGKVPALIKRLKYLMIIAFASNKKKWQ